MKNLILLIFLALIAFESQAKIRIAIIDTTIDRQWLGKGLICDNKVYKTSFVKDVYDKDVHADSVIDTIHKMSLNNFDFCIVPIVWHSTDANNYAQYPTAQATSNSLIEALRILNNMDNIDYVNMSLDGSYYSPPIEKAEFEKLNKKNIPVFLAAGNQHQVLNKYNCNYYPTCYSLTMENIIIVGSYEVKYTRGEIVDVRAQASYDGKYGELKGTSQAVPRALAMHILKKGLTQRKPYGSLK